MLVKLRALCLFEQPVACGAGERVYDSVLVSFDMVYKVVRPRENLVTCTDTARKRALCCVGCPVPQEVPLPVERRTTIWMCATVLPALGDAASAFDRHDTESTKTKAQDVPSRCAVVTRSRGKGTRRQDGAKISPV
jgi:hypothetical protein